MTGRVDQIRLRLLVLLGRVDDTGLAGGFGHCGSEGWEVKEGGGDEIVSGGASRRGHCREQCKERHVWLQRPSGRREEEKKPRLL